jgi:hypothetical protein
MYSTAQANAPGRATHRGTPAGEQLVDGLLAVAKQLAYPVHRQPAERLVAAELHDDPGCRTRRRRGVVKLVQACGGKKVMLEDPHEPVAPTRQFHAFRRRSPKREHLRVGSS